MLESQGGSFKIITSFLKERTSPKLVFSLWKQSCKKKLNRYQKGPFPSLTVNNNYKISHITVVKPHVAATGIQPLNSLVVTLLGICFLAIRK